MKFQALFVHLKNKTKNSKIFAYQDGSRRKFLSYLVFVFKELIFQMNCLLAGDFLEIANLIKMLKNSNTI